METIIRTASRADVDRIRAIAMDNKGVRFLPASLVEDAILTRTCVVATWKNRVVGFLIWRYHRDIKMAEVVEIVVEHYSHRKGIGTNLLNHLKKECQRYGYERIGYKHPHHYPEPRFFLGSGFVLSGQEPSLICTFDVYTQELVRELA